MTAPSSKRRLSALDASEYAPRFIVGVDLGTTNSAVAFVDLEELQRDARPQNAERVQIFPIPQAVAPGVWEARQTLPSFFARRRDVPTLPTDPPRKENDADDGLRDVVGVFARDYGPDNPDAFVSSAKSWLCCPAVDRAAKFLPLNATRDDSDDRRRGARRAKWSPVEISARFLERIRVAWNDAHPDDPLEKQFLVVAIPASFDETARELTVAAAKLAKLPRVALVEEPQAAFYSWLEGREDSWFEFVKPGDKILVCDVGGGTTDFALIRALERGGDENEQNVKFYRVAVGEHLLLGGDNLDLALANALEAKFFADSDSKPTPRERAILLKESRKIKEEFLADPSDAEVARRALLPRAGAKLVGGARAIDVSKREVVKTLVDGFFPSVPFDAVPARRRVGVREIALPYAVDPAVTKHLAQFLRVHRNAERELERAGAFATSKIDGNAERSARPDAVLFNGGVFESPILRDRIVDSLVEWFGKDDPTWRPKILRNDSLHLAVARGAARFGLALQGLGMRVGASLARSYYAEVACEGASNGVATSKRGARRGVCILHAQAEPGDETPTPQVFDLEVDRPVSFPIFVSSVRATDAPGDLVELDPNETRELPPIRTALKTRSQTKKRAGRIKARLVARPTEIGTIELFLQEIPEDGKRASRWSLRFDARGATQTDWEEGNVNAEREGVVDESFMENALRVVDATFGDDDLLRNATLERVKPRDFVRAIERAFELSKNEIPAPALRRLAERALELDQARKKNPVLEARRLNWLGFALRPGFGVAADDWRVEQTWKSVAGQLANPAIECRVQYWVLWRRVASGLAPGRQQALAAPIVTNLRNLRRQLVEGRGKGADLNLTNQEGAEIWRLIGSLEMLSNDAKEEIGDLLLDVMTKSQMAPVRDALAWTLGRLGARKLFHATLDRTLAPGVAQRWIQRLMTILREQDAAPTASEGFALAQLARRVEQSDFNVDVKTREEVADFLEARELAESTLAALEKRERRSRVDDQIFGEALPLGLTWRQGEDPKGCGDDARAL